MINESPWYPGVSSRFALCLVGCSKPQVGTVLEYEIDRSGLETDTQVNLPAVVAAVERRA